MRKIKDLIKTKILNVLKNNFFKSVVLISGGTAFAQMLTILTSPVITRLYSPEEYGVLTIFNSILVIVALVGSLKYELIIPIVDEEKRAINAIVLSSLILMIFVIVTSLIMATIGNHILLIIGAEKLINYWYFIPIGILLAQLYRITTQYAYRQKNFKGITQTTATQSVIGNLSKIFSGLFGFGVVGLLFSRILSESVGITTLSKPLLKKKELFKKINRTELIWIANRYKKFPIYQFPSTLIGQLSINLPVFFMGFIFDSKVVGAFGLANSIVRLPMNLIGKSVSNVFFAEAASIGKTNTKGLKKLSDEILKRLVMLGLIPMITLLLFAPSMFSFVFGDSWIEAGEFARILSILVFFDFIFSPVSRVFEVFEKQKQVLILNSLRVLLSLVAFGLAIYFEVSPNVTIYMYTVSMSLTYLLTYITAQNIMKNAMNNQ